LLSWVKQVNISSVGKFSNGSVLIDEFGVVAGSYIVGGNLTDGGIVLSSSGVSWSNITSGQVSLNAVAFDQGTTILAVGYQGAIVALPMPEVSSDTYHDVVNDGSKFVIVGDNGTIKTTVDGVTLTDISVPAGVDSYDLTGAAYADICGNPTYVAVGTKTSVTPGNYWLLILVSNDGIIWTIDDEVEFTSSYDPAVSQIKVLYCTDNGDFIINGSTLQVIIGVPGSWSSPAGLQYFDYLPLKSLTYKYESGLNFYAVFGVSSCGGDGLVWVKYNASLSAYVSQGYIEFNTGLFGYNERCSLIWDATNSHWIATFYNHFEGKFVVSVSTDLVYWSKQVNETSTNMPKGIVSSDTKTFIVGGDSTTDGVAYVR
jgi:hypothetical protein